MSHSNQVREYVLTNEGLKIVDVYHGDAGVLTGSARLAQGVISKADSRRRVQETERMTRALDRKRAAVERQIAEIRASFEAEEDQMLRTVEAGRPPEIDQANGGQVE